MNKKHKYYIGGLKFSGDALKVINRMTNLSNPQKDAIATFVDDGVTAGWWNNNIDELYIFSLGSANGTVGFKIKTGSTIGGTYSSNGLGINGGELFKSNWNPTTDAINYSKLDSFVGTFIHTYSSPSSLRNIIYADNNTKMVDDISSTRALVRLHVSNNLLKSPYTFLSDSMYFIINSGNNIKFKRNGSNILTGNKTGAAIPNAEYLLSGGASATDTIFGAFVTGVHTSMDYVDFEAKLRTLLTSLTTSFFVGFPFVLPFNLS